MEIINVGSANVGGEVVQTVNARDLHTYLGVGKKFTDWIKGRIDKYDFVADLDYTTVNPNFGNNSVGRPSVDYHISLGMAKELSMTENNVQGKAARRYFIECEKRLNNTPKGIVLDNPMQLREALLSYTEKVIALQEVIEKKDDLLELQKPAVYFVDTFVERGLNTCLSDGWKALGAKPTLFTKMLIEEGVLFRRVGGKTVHAKQAHINAGHFVERFSTYGTQTLVTPKGVLFLSKKYKAYLDMENK